MSRNNKNFNKLRAALKLSRNDIHELMNGRVSKSLIDGWGRGEDATKNGTGNSSMETVSRFREMSDDDFDLFCTGILELLKQENAHEQH